MSMRRITLVLAITLVAADPYESFHGVNGKDTIVHLFQWKWSDIANECEQFLSKWGYGAVRVGRQHALMHLQTSPPNEHLWALDSAGDMPWWIDYQPVSYLISSRRGSRAQFTDMVNRCNAVGVRVIADVVSNHMVGVGTKKGNSGVGSWGPSDFDGTDGVEQFPGVPYGPGDFNDKYCHGDIQDGDYKCCADHVRRCRLVGLLDLNHDTDYVRGRVAAYISDLLSLGVAGVRLDAAKHMYPANIAAFLALTTNVRQDVSVLLHL